MPSLPGIGTEKVTGFDLQSANPLDAARAWVANQVGRLDIDFPYQGLITIQGDTGQKFKYKGDETTNIASDWELVSTYHGGSGEPATTLGVLGDFYIDYTSKQLYEKTGASTWANRGALGSEWIVASGTPNDLVGRNGDLYLNTATGDYYQKNAGTWGASSGNLTGPPGNDGQDATGVSYYGGIFTESPSAQAITDAAGFVKVIGFTDNDPVQSGVTADHTNDQITIDNDGIYVVSFVGEASLSVGVGSVKIFRNGVAQNKGVIKLPSGGTEAFSLELTLNLVATDIIDVRVDVTVDSNVTFDSASLRVYTTGAQGLTGDQGRAFTVTEDDITFNEAKIASVQGGAYTQAAPYVASILNDSRSNKLSPSSLQGDLRDKVVAWDGSSWINYGTWRGPQGLRGIQGIQGPRGNDGSDAVFQVLKYGEFNPQNKTVVNLNTEPNVQWVSGSNNFDITWTTAVNLTLTLVGTSGNAPRGFGRVTVATTNDRNVTVRSNSSSGLIYGAGRTPNRNFTFSGANKVAHFIAITNDRWYVLYDEEVSRSRISWENNIYFNDGDESSILANTIDFTSFLTTASRIYPAHLVSIETRSILRIQMSCLIEADSNQIDTVSLYLEIQLPSGGSYRTLKRKRVQLTDNGDMPLHITEIYNATQIGNYRVRLRTVTEIGGLSRWSRDAEYEVMIVQQF